MEAPLPRASAEALTEEKPITNAAGCLVSKALYEALHEGPPSQCLSAGAIRLRVVAHWEVTVLILSILAETSAFSLVNIGSCAPPRNARIPKYVSFGRRVNSLNKIISGS